MLENCNYVIELAKEMDFVIVGMQGRVDMVGTIHDNLLTQWRHMPMGQLCTNIFFSNYLWASEVSKNCCIIRSLWIVTTMSTLMQGNDIRQGSRNLVLGLVWQIMRAYTLNLLKKLSSDGTPISETEILSWANKKLVNHGKHMQVKSFQVRYIK